MSPRIKPLTLALAVSAIGTTPLALAGEENIELPEVRVSGSAYANGEAASGYRVNTLGLGPLGSNASQDTPYTVNTASSELIANTQASNSSEALKYVPTVYTNTGASQITPYFTIRGLSASSWTYNMAVDGMRSFDIYQPMEDKAGIEVLSGASGFLFGITSPAGMINYQTKRPTHAPLKELTVGLYDHQLYAAVNLGGPLGGRSDLAYRFNLGVANGGETGTDGMRQERYSISGAIDWQVSADTLLTLDAAHARRDIDRPQALFVPSLASGIPKAPDATKNWGPDDGDTLDVTSRISLGLESRLNDTWTVRAKLRYSDDRRRYLMGRQYWQNADLDYRWRLDGQDEHQRRAWQYNLYLDAAFTTGALRHKLTAGRSEDDFRQDWNGYQTRYTTAGAANWYAGNLHGNAWAPDLSTAPGTQQKQHTHYETWLLADRIALSERWEIMLGANWARVNDQLTGKTVANVLTRTSYDERELTPAVSLSFKPVPTVTTYVSYIEGLEQGFVSTSSGNPGQAFPPYVSRQQEIGVKATLGGMLLTAAGFRIDKANQMVENNVASQDGRALHRGLEFSATGRLTRNLRLLGGFTLVDAKVKKAANNLNEGKTPQGAPKKMARLYVEYDLPGVPGLTLTGGLSHVGKVPVDAANTLYVRAVNVADLGLRYQRRILGRETTLRLGVANVADKRYWATRSGMLYPGAPRTLMASATLVF